MGKILTVLTGGTIGSKAKNHIIDVDNRHAYTLLARYTEKYGNAVCFEAVQPMHILSENITYSDWNILCAYLFSVELAAYDGVIITHGSDTLSYTAALLSFLLRHTPVPVVLVAANRPLEDTQSNGLLNFKNAVDFIKNAGLPGVFVSYANRADTQWMYLASRMRESDPYLDAFSSFGGEAFGTMQNGRFIWNNNPCNPAPETLMHVKGRLLNKAPVFRNSVVCIRPYPNIDYGMVNIKNAKTVLLYLYHSATACTQGIDFSAVRLIERCRGQGVAVFGASFKQKQENGLYATENALLQAGLRPLFAISLEAAYAKLCIAYNQSEKPPEEILEQNLFYEILPQPEI